MQQPEGAGRWNSRNLGNNLHSQAAKCKDSLWSGGTGQAAGTFSLHWMWQAKPQTSQTTPCRVRPTMMEVQWLHFRGDENVRMRNWCAFAFGPTCNQSIKFRNCEWQLSKRN